MGVAPTGAIFKGLTFDGESSKDYGIYITGSAVFNAPARDVEMITIPGRNGTFALDHGRFENIEVTYPAGVFGDTEADFAQGISDFRNFLASRQGYVELSDDYNPGEYRLAVYKSGLEVTPAQLKAGEFEIVFDCKPQRWLTAGQDPVTVTTGDEINNPTLFDASPLLLVDGYGQITLGDGGIVKIDNVPVGNTEIAPRSVASGSNYTGTITATTTIEGAKMNTGDAFTVGIDGSLDIWSGGWSKDGQTTTAAGITSGSVIPPASPAVMTQSAGVQFGTARIYWAVTGMNFVYGTAKTFGWFGFEAYTEGYPNTSPSIQLETAPSISIRVKYNGTDTITMEVDVTDIYNTFNAEYMTEINDVYGNSSKNATGNPLYIDLDIGEAYKIEGGQVISSNSAVQLGAKLAVLEPGNNTITFPNTVTSLQIVPRYWKL